MAAVMQHVGRVQLRRRGWSGGGLLISRIKADDGFGYRGLHYAFSPVATRLTQKHHRLCGKVLTLNHTSSLRLNSTSSGATDNKISGFLLDASPNKDIIFQPESPPAAIATQDLGFVIPERPAIPQVSSPEVLDVLGEPSITTLDLGGWSPSGMLQHCLEFLHVGLDIPWWAAIVIGTCVVRITLFPLVVISQRNAARMNNYLPQIQLLQLKMTEARRTGNALLAAKYANELMQYMKEKNLNPLKNMMVPMAQAPVFISFFFALRGMANAPVESMKDGGLYWFTNLTVPDPMYLLPLITSLTLAATIELGVDGGMRADSLQMMRYVLRALPVIMFPFIINFPAAVLCYWTTSNFISLGQVALLRYPPVRAFFKIDKLIKHDPEKMPVKKKGFVEGFKESYSNLKITRDIEDRSRVDEMRFRKAGLGPIQKTYPYDPTRQRIAATKSTHAAAQAKPTSK